MSQWRGIFSVTVALALAAAGAWFIGLTAGQGGVLTTAVGAAAITWLVARRRKPRPRRTVWIAASSVLAVSVLWTAVSIVRYVTPAQGEPMSQLVAGWGRNHQLGPLVDYLETFVYSSPPTRTPAQQLTLDPTLGEAGGTNGRTKPGRAAAGTSGTSGTVATTAVTATTTPTPRAPAPIAPLLAHPLAGEGQWVSVAKAGGQDAIWATSIRPLPDFGGVVASVAVIDQTHLRVGLFNGSELPGGHWARGNRVPSALYPALVAAFNGGFRFEQMKGGYLTEGTTVKPLRNGDASLAVGKDGRLVLGTLGRDLFNDGSWISIRQNLSLIVDHGASQVTSAASQLVYWGADYGRKVYVPRSAVCQLADGRLAYVFVSDVDAAQLGTALVNIGCQKAIQLDINGNWPAMFQFDHASDGSLQSHPLDHRMSAPAGRYLSGSKKDFFAFFDAGLVPANSVLDA